MKLIKHILFLLFCFQVANGKLLAQAPKNFTASEIEQEIKKTRNGASVLYIAAHPDDENTRLISWLANEKCVRTAYLSLTRGDGGQNLIGSEQGPSLGVIRTQELLAARRIDGGEQFFTHAYDFGYSKTPEETFEKWGKEAILADVVYIIRHFKPDVIITRFATDGSGGHGHHTASALLAEEAFEAAADPLRFPEQLTEVTTWKPKRLLYNSAARFWNPNADMSGHLKVNVGEYNTQLGKSYGELAAESRSMHRSQGFGSAKQRGEQFEYFKIIKGDTGIKDIFSGVDLSLNRYATGKKFDGELKKLEEAWEDKNIKECNQILKKALDICFQENSDIPAYQRTKIYQLILQMNGIFLEAVSEGTATTAQGDSVKIKLSAINRNNATVVLESIDILLNGGVFPRCDKSMFGEKTETALLPNKSFNKTLPLYVCDAVNPSQLYWLESPIKGNKFTHRNNLKPQGLTSGFVCGFTLKINGNSFQFWEPLQYKWVDPDKGEQYRPHLITPPATINLSSKSLVFVNGESKKLKIQIKALKANIKGALQCGTSVYPFEIAKKGDYTDLEVMLDSKASKNEGSFPLILMVNDYQSTFNLGYEEIKYDHIPVQTLFPKAELKLQEAVIQKKLKRVGYISGAGDEVAACLNQIGYEVVTINDEMIKEGNLNEFSTIVMGVRAYNTNDLLSIYNKRLMAYVENGGNLIVQYNTNSFAGPFKGDIGPFPFKISRNRITQENAPIKLLEPNHPILNTPNKINEKDFENWVQERSIYEATEADQRYTSLIGMNDPNEKETRGSLITCAYGKGHYTYTGLVFFRQLPAGNTGAYRLFVNLIEQGN
jgi:LmbE family N-acetylglucosaminyl deacetylase